MSIEVYEDGFVIDSYPSEDIGASEALFSTLFGLGMEDSAAAVEGDEHYASVTAVVGAYGEICYEAKTGYYRKLEAADRRQEEEL